jgi:hypothetical protein
VTTGKVHLTFANWRKSTVLSPIYLPEFRQLANVPPPGFICSVVAVAADVVDDDDDNDNDKYDFDCLPVNPSKLSILNFIIYISPRAGVPVPAKKINIIRSTINVKKKELKSLPLCRTTS